MNIQLLGSPQVRCADGLRPIFKTAKAAGLLYYLASTQRTHSRATLATLLWGDMAEDKARVNLSKALSELREQLGEYITITTQTVTFNRALPYQIDIEAFLSAAAPTKAAQSPASLQAAADLYCSDFLDGFHVRNAPEFEQWQLAERERLRMVAVPLFARLAHRYQQDGSVPGAINTLRRLLRLEPWQEEAHYQLMDLLARSGNYHAALRQFELCRQALASELDVEPGEEITRLYLALRINPTTAGRLPGPPEALASAAETGSHPAIPHSLPYPPTAFVGRAAEIQALLARLQDPACRLLTLLGAGGFGKTRLAIRMGELVMAAPEQFPDGVFFVALGGSEGRAFVISAVAAALAFTFYEQDNQEDQLLRYLAPKRLLLILDNAEEILDPDLVLRMLTQAPHVKLLVTSREALNLQQEWLRPIGGMDAGTPDDEAGSEDGDNRQPQEPDAVSLFRQCALRVQPAFDVQRELVHVRYICRLVDGAPLAIELAATWLKALPCAQVACELARGVDLLATTMRDVPARHRSMRAVLKQSWDYLAEDDQRVFCQMSVFEGGFRLEAAQAVAEAPLWVLATLVAKSMQQLRPDGRYYIHALLRQLGAEHLAARPAEMVAGRERHSAYYMSYLAERKIALTGQVQMDALRGIQEEIDNIRVAWSYVAAQGRLLSLREAQPALFRFLWMRGRYAEAEQMAYQALEGSAAAVLTDEEQVVRIALMANAAQVAGAMGCCDRALAEAQLALVGRQSCANAAVAHCYYVLGMVQAYAQDRAAIASLRTAYDLYRAQGDPAGAAEVATQLGFYLWAWDDAHESASTLIEASLAVFRALGDHFDLADALNQAALLRWYAGDVEQAERLYQDSLHTARTVDNRLVALQAVGGLAIVAMARAQWDLAIELQHERLAMAQRLGHDNQVKHSLSFLVTAYVYAERYREAAAILKQLPEIWHNSYAAQAYVGIGAYAIAFSFLCRATAEKIADYPAMPYIAVALVGWIMLLESDCDPLMLCDSTGLRMMTREEREALVVEVLTAVQSYRPADPATRAQASRLLARQGDKAKDLPYHGKLPPVRSVRELAGEMLTLRLG